MTSGSALTSWAAGVSSGRGVAAEQGRQGGYVLLDRLTNCFGDRDAGEPGQDGDPRMQITVQLSRKLLEADRTRRRRPAIEVACYSLAPTTTASANAKSTR